MKRESCISFVKIKGNWGNSGLCEYKDGRVNLEQCKKCEDYKASKYNKDIYEKI